MSKILNLIMSIVSGIAFFVAIGNTGRTTIFALLTLGSFAILNFIVFAYEIYSDYFAKHCICHICINTEDKMTYHEYNKNGGVHKKCLPVTDKH
jgi:hypothetical protein